MPSPAAVVAPSMLIRTGSAEVTVDSLDAGLAKVRGLAARVGGMIGNTQMSGGRGMPRSATLELRIPADKWDETVAGLNSVGRLESMQTNAEDVGEEFVDVQARIANAKKLEERLIQLLASRTGKLSDVVEVETKLAEVRESIERLEGRARYLRERAAVSRLSITVHEPSPLLEPRGTPSVIAEAFRNAWRNFINFLAFLIASLGIIIPLGVIVWLAWTIRRRWRRA